MARSIGFIAVMVALLGGFATPTRAQVTLSISCSSLGIELELCQEGANEWGKQTGNSVKLVATPPNAEERLALYQQLLAAGSADIDVFQIDVVWPGTLASHFLDLTPYIPPEDLKDHFETLTTNDTVEGKLVAVPFFVDAGLLFYRQDLLDKYGKKPPRDWSELTETAKAIIDGERAGNAQLQGYVWQGRAYEGLTCNSIEWVASFGGGTIVETDGKISINNARAAAALTLARSWIGTISPEGVLNYAEEDSRGVFQSGNAVFMRNWPYAWALANAPDSPVKGKVGIAVLPQGAGDGARHASALGGQHLAVSKYSAHPKEAADLVRYLTSAGEQKRRAMKGSFNPTRKSLYDDQELLQALPFLKDFEAVLENAVARPSTVTGAKYSRASSEYVRAVHNTLTGKGTAEENLAGLEKQLERISRGGKW
ncbi:ABC transporter substrate-binding protein [Taklimakanibacter lacteus]|uniref:ABC transporter substrate-binding protein n=1 Tax=Taklimakanibacter lacteus TaxID=2268456 RepID=UPI000E66E31B